jgi:hypothetical protein
MKTPVCTDVTKIANISANITNNSLKDPERRIDEEMRLRIKSDPLCVKRSCGTHSYCFLGIYIYIAPTITAFI